jgi:hypothetical protein
MAFHFREEKKKKQNGNPLPGKCFRLKDKNKSNLYFVVKTKPSLLRNKETESRREMVT